MISDYMDLTPDFREREREEMQPTYDAWGTVLPASDRTAKGSVRVKVKTMKENMDTFDDVPVLTCYGGDDYGTCFLPEEGDVVRLTFIGGDFRHPVVTGCRFPENSRFVQDVYEKKNLNKEWKIKGGSRIAFSGAQGEERIEIAGPKNMLWELDEKQQQIAFGDNDRKNRLLLDKKEGKTQITSEKVIRLECGKSSLELKKDGTVTLQCEQLDLKAKKINISGKSGVKLEGQEISLSGKNGVSLSGQGQVKVESKSSLKLSGAMIHLN